MSETTIQISPANLTKVRELLHEGKKIAAIKLARTTGREMPGKVVQNPEPGAPEIDHRPGLRNAKEAVEALNGQHLNPAARFTASLRIKKVIIEGQTGNIELDIDQLQLRCLDGLSQGIPLSEVAAMTELVTFIRKWQDGDEE